MASKQSDAVRELWTSWMEGAKTNPNETLDDVRARVAHWGDLTAEPDDVDNVEIEVAGLPTLWAIPEGSAETYESNRETEPFFHKEVVGELTAMFLAGGDPKDALASPLFAHRSGVPPMYIQVGGDETLLDDSRQLERRALDAGVEVRLDVFPEQLHTFQMAAGRAPEADDAIRRFADWVGPRLGLVGAN
jgi:acetyl esterase/lipase